MPVLRGLGDRFRTQLYNLLLGETRSASSTIILEAIES